MRAGRIVNGVLPFLYLLILRPAPLAAQPPAVFEPEELRREGPPLWVPAEAVADPETIIDVDKVDSLPLRLNVEKQRQELGTRQSTEKSGTTPKVESIPQTSCVRSLSSTGEDHRGGSGSTSTLTALAANARSILRGTVRRVDLGFQGGLPGALLSLEISDAVKGVAPAATVFVLYPIAHFRIGPFQFCNGHKGFEPSPGDEVLLFDYIGPIDRDQLLFAPRLDQLIFQERSGSLYLPPQLRASSDLVAVGGLSGIADHLRSKNNTGGGAP